MAEALLFVYGTLRRGLENHHLLAGARHVGDGRTATRHALFVEGIPFLAEHPPVHHVRGEVWAVDEATLAELDLLEGHPTWYQRRPVDVVLDVASRAATEARRPGDVFGDAPSVVRCEAYFNDRPQGALSSSGDFLKHVGRPGRGGARRRR